MIRSELFFSKLNIDVTTLLNAKFYPEGMKAYVQGILTANSEMTSSIFTKLMNPGNKTDMKDVCNYLRIYLNFFSVHEEISSKMWYHIFEFISNEPNKKL
jgi:hypothetical protein